MYKKIIPILIFIILSYSGYKNYFKNGFFDQSVHQTMTELGLFNLQNSGVIWYGCYSYFNDNYVIDLLYKTRDCKNIINRGEFKPGHNKYDFMNDTNLTYIVGGLWKPNVQEINYYMNNYNVSKYKGVEILRKQPK